MDLIMNKSDVKLVGIILIIVIVSLVLINLNKKEGSMAEVYYEDRIVLTIDMNINREYIVDGALGEVVIEVLDKKIRVKEETSSKHLCSKEGFTNDSLRPIICLPNKIVIKIINKKDNNDIDGVVY